MKINLSSIQKHIQSYIKTYYELEERPDVPDLDPSLIWVKDMLRKHVWYNIIQHELNTFENISIQGDPSNCLKKYKIQQKINTTEYKLQGNKIAKLTLISLWQYKYKNDLEETIKVEFNICKDAYEKGLGAKVHDTFICFNANHNCAYKVIIKEQTLNTCTLEEWLEQKHTAEEKTRVYNLVKKQIDLMHSNNIIHKSLWTNTIILKLKHKKVDSVIIDNFDHAYYHSKTSQMDDLWLLGHIKQKEPSYNHADEVLNYIVYNLITKKQLVIE